VHLALHVGISNELLKIKPIIIFDQDLNSQDGI